MGVRMMMMGLLGLLIGCNGCRVPSCEDSAQSWAIELGDVWLGGEVARRLPIDANENSEITTAEGEEAEYLPGEGYIDLRWTPTEVGELSLNLLVDGCPLTLTATVVEPAVWPEPLATSITMEPLDSLDETEMGDAVFPATGPVPFATDPITGEVWFGAAEQGRAWRMDVFYNHSSWGMWVGKDFEEKGSWINAPACFGDDTSGLRQTGICTGAERDVDGSIPDNWRYLHGGFIGEHAAFPGEEITGISAMITDEDAERIWMLGDDDDGGWLAAIDIGLAPGEGEGDGSDPYTFRQPVPDIAVSLGADWTDLRGGLFGSDLWIASLSTGRIATLTLPDGSLTELATIDGLLEAAQVGDALLAITDSGLIGISLTDGEELFSEERPAGLPEGAPLATWATEEDAWMVFPELMLQLTPSGEMLLVLPPEESLSLAGVVGDVVRGGNAETLEMLYAVGTGSDSSVLWGASPQGVWYGEPLSLPATPRALGHARDPHDIFILYAAGSEGCDDPELGSLCENGERPPVVHALYNPYSLVPPTSTGHPLNLFISPIIETPKDNSLGSDFSQGLCTGVEDYADVSCCALSGVLAHRLQPNVDYFAQTIQTLGDSTDTTDDDPTLVWGINPTLLRQAFECLESENSVDQQAGASLYDELITLPDARSSLANWTHTAAGETQVSDPQNWFVAQAPDVVDYDPPVSDQYEYELLHDGMGAIFDPTRLPEGAGALRSLDPAVLWTPLVSGNSLDAFYIDEYTGWNDPDWLTPIRDAPLSISQPPRAAYYFLSAGVELEIGMTKYRKKELYPIDIRERVVDWLNTDITTPGVPDPESGVANLPGMSWEIGTISALSEAGAFRETLRFSVDVDQNDWDYATRYIRRLIASSQPEDVKSWYIHIFDISNPNGLFTDNSGVTADTDITRDTIQQINDDFVTPGYARWALPEEILVEWDDAQ